MPVYFMRKVDFWIGVPLTFFFTLIVKPWSLFRKKADRKHVKNVLFIELSEMGSAILADAALKKVSANYKAYFVIFKKNAISLQLLKTIPPERVCTLREDSLLNLVVDSIRFIFWCRRHRIEASVDLELFSRFTALLSVASGAFMRIGYLIPNGEGLYRGNLLTHSVAYNSHLHISKNFISLVEPLFAETENGFYVKRLITDQEIAFAPAVIAEVSLEKLRNSIRAVFPHYSERTKVVLLNVNAGDLLPQRRWPLANFTALAQKIMRAYPDVLILLTGSKSEKDYVSQVALSLQSKNCVNFAGHVAFEDLPALYVLSTLIVTNDSGPAHFASAVGLRTFVLFGPETPRLYGPLQNTTSITAGLACSPCVTANNHRNTACTENVCMKAISPELVFSLIDRHLTDTTGTKNLAEENASESRLA